MLLVCLNLVLGGWGLAFAASSVVSPHLLLMWGSYLLSVLYFDLAEWWLCHHFPFAATLSSFNG
jgi:hypothetical protein